MLDPNLERQFNKIWGVTSAPGATTSRAEEIRKIGQEAATQKAQSEKKTVGGFASNIIPSALGVAEGIGEAVKHPVKTVTSIGKTLAGGVQSIPAVSDFYDKHASERGKDMVSENKQAFESVVKYFGDRYGGKDVNEVVKSIGDTAYKDPVGFALDLSSIFSGGQAVAGKVSKVAEAVGATKTAKVASQVSKAAGVAAEATNPIVAPMKLFGKATELLTKGKQIGGKTYNPEAVKAADNLGIPKENLPVSAMTDSKVAVGAEALSAKGLFGDKISQGIKNVYESLSTKVAEITKNSPSLNDLGKNLSGAVDDFENEYFKQRKNLYKEASVPKSMSVGSSDVNAKPVVLTAGELSDTRELLKSLIKSEKEGLKGMGQVTSPELKTYEGLVNGLSTNKITIREVLKTVDKLDDDIKYGTSIKTGNNAKLSLIRQTLDNEISARLKEVRPDLAEALEKADAFYAEGLNKINSEFSQAIIKNADKPDIIVDSVLPKLKSIEDIKQLESMIGEENMGNLRKAFIGKFFDGSKFTPTGIAREIKKFGGEEKLEAFLTPEQFQTVKDMEKLTESLQKGQKILEGSQTAYLAKIGIQAGATSAGLISLFSGNIPGFFAALSPVMGDFALNKFVSSQIGRKLLTEGLELSGRTGQSIQKTAPGLGAGTNVIQQGGKINAKVQEGSQE